MNKIAISLALVTVCIGIVAANKHVSQHSEDNHEVTNSHHHPAKYEFGSCEEECNYVCKPRYYHGHGNGHRHRHGKGHGRHNEGGKGKYPHGKQVDFYPSHQYPYYEPPFYPYAGEHPSGFYPAFKHPSGEFHDTSNGHPFKVRKPKGKRISSRKGGNESGGKSGTKRGEHQPHEAQGKDVVDAELDIIRADFTQNHDDANEGFHKDKIKEKDLTIIKDHTTEGEQVNQFANNQHDSESGHVSEGHGHVFAASANN